MSNRGPQMATRNGSLPPRTTRPISRTSAPSMAPGRIPMGSASSSGNAPNKGGMGSGRPTTVPTKIDQNPGAKRMQIPPPSSNGNHETTHGTKQPALAKHCHGSNFAGKISCMVIDHSLVTFGAILVLSVYCWYRRRRTQGYDLDRGEYRQVAARYTDSAFADDDYSAGGDDYQSDDDDGVGWSTSAHNGRQVIEMKKIEKNDDANGNLSLYETNG